MGMATVPGALEDFARRETNRALLSRAAVAEALLLLHEHGLPLHADTPKNWDGLLATVHAARTAPHDALVLDAWAEMQSAFLPGLARLGFTRLLGVGRSFRDPMRRGPIEHRFGDIERLDLPDASVGCAASLSIVEHGVDVPRFFAEMARVLVPGGRLFVSTDYWGPGVDTGGNGALFRPFDARDAAAAVEAARGCGLSPTGPLGMEVSEPVVHWRRMGVRYTFHNLLLRNPP